MDIVLEIFDTFIGDHVWAAIFPAKSAPYDYPQTSGNASAAAAAAAGISSSAREQQSFSSWTYKPATDYFSIQPYQAAYMSQWPRDNVWRQGISLYAITW
jgi:lathosterol oxidase